jgi:hypothetical protein
MKSGSNLETSQGIHNFNLVSVVSCEDYFVGGWRTNATLRDVHLQNYSSPVVHLAEKPALLYIIS